MVYYWGHDQPEDKAEAEGLQLLESCMAGHTLAQALVVKLAIPNLI